LDKRTAPRERDHASNNTEEEEEEEEKEEEDAVVVVIQFLSAAVPSSPFVFCA
jgi:ribosomal protein L12E/L44/L45/RPP1/RPP2